MQQPIKRKQLLLYALPEYAVYLASIPVVLYLPFVYSRNVGLDLGDVGIILFVARLSDVITDPLIGYFSDRTKTRMGRRKPWIAAGSLLLMFAAYRLFNPPEAIGNVYLLIWAVLLWLGWTMINIPYYAWGAELSEDYHERTQITGARQLFGFLGNVSVLAIPVLSGHAFGYGSKPSEGLAIIGGMVLVVLPVVMTLTLTQVPEPDRYGSSHSPLFRHMRRMWRDGSFMLLFVAFMLMSLGTGWGSATFMLFATFVVDAEDQTQAILLGYYFANVLALPVWVKLAGRFGKKETWIAGGILFVLVTPCFLLLGAGDLGWFFLILSLYGIAGGNFGALSMSMKADVIELAARRSGENVAGAYIAVWSLGQKFVIALSLLLALQILEATGFDAKGNNGPEELRALSLVYVLPPWLFYALAVLVLWRYPLSAKRLERLRGALDRRATRLAR